MTEPEQRFPFEDDLVNRPLPRIRLPLGAEKTSVWERLGGVGHALGMASYGVLTIEAALVGIVAVILILAIPLSFLFCCLGWVLAVWMGILLLYALLYLSAAGTLFALLGLLCAIRNLEAAVYCSGALALNGGVLGVCLSLLWR